MNSVREYAGQPSPSWPASRTLAALHLDGMAFKAKKFRAVAPVCGQLFNGLCVITNFFNGTQVKGSCFHPLL